MLRSLRQAGRRFLYGEPVIVVSGLPRSGTSMAMRMLEAGGLPVVTDGLRTADDDNPQGYFELERVKALAREVDTGWLRNARGRAIKVISYLLRDLPPTNNYRVVFMHRDLDEVLASQRRMLERRGETSATGDERMRELFAEHLGRVRHLLERAPHFRAIEVRYAEVLRRPREEAHRIDAFLGRRLDVERMASVVDEGLYRNRAAARD